MPREACESPKVTQNLEGLFLSRERVTERWLVYGRESLHEAGSMEVVGVKGRHWVQTQATGSSLNLIALCEDPPSLYMTMPPSTHKSSGLLGRELGGINLNYFPLIELPERC